uniref:La-related protein 6A n=2 Tax=Rhizophora mucronata TaxID=61149 RepID=A0A2P2KWX6_RHIMU
MDGEDGATVASTETASPQPQPKQSESSSVAVSEEARAPPSDKEHDYDPDEEPDHDGRPMEPAIQTEDLGHRIIKQVEYYFSDENLATDKHMINLIRKNKEGLVPISVIASFRKMKKLTGDHSIIVAALRESSSLVVSSDGKKVKRLNPFPLKEVKDPKFCTVLVENLPEEHSMENMQKLFGGAGKIRNIFIRDPHAMEKKKKGSKSDILISSKLHALVEYETVEAAEKAVATINNEQDWRNGMRVKLLKQIGKYGQRKQSWKESDSARSSIDHASNQIVDEENHNLSEHHDDTPDEEEVEHVSKEKNGQGGRNRWSRRSKYRSHNGMGHGTTSSTHVIEPSKPPPGPKMPDGTRGFTMGRGRPPTPNQKLSK